MKVQESIFDLVNKLVAMLNETAKEVSYGDTLIKPVPDLFIDHNNNRWPAVRFTNRGEGRHVLVVEHETDFRPGRYWMMFVETNEAIKIEHSLGGNLHIVPPTQPWKTFYDDEVGLIRAYREMLSFLMLGMKPSFDQ